MTNSVLILTFSPVQSFIEEARRAADLYTGSQILVRLARAAGEDLQTNGAVIIYPSSLTSDMPNKIVAQVMWEDFDEKENPATKAKSALLWKWKQIAEEAKGNFRKDDFDTIWDRQVAEDNLWEIYWTVAKMENGDYAKAYLKAEAALQAVKLNRTFKQSKESGFKDTLSGKREALHDTRSGREYWEALTQSNSPIVPIKVRPDGRERLDAIGVIKRFSPIAETSIAPFNHFPSTSSIASLDYLEKAQTIAKEKLADHAEAVFTLLGKNEKYYVRDNQQPWRFDGDLLYPETFTAKRLERDFGIKLIQTPLLNKAKNTLQGLIQSKISDDEKLGEPSPYYAIIKLDGDDMGEYIRACKTQDEHKKFSERLSNFSEIVKKIADEPQYHARIIYNGGDDVLAMASLSKAVEFAKVMADKFKDIVGGSASAGIVITHHLSPLSNALKQARKAEDKAKASGKNAVCVTVLRRSGETLQMVSEWEQIEKFFAFVSLFANKELASKLPYDIAQASYALPKASEMSAAEIRRLVKRHSTPNITEADDTKRRELIVKWIKEKADDLQTWSSRLPRQVEELADWLSLARFISQGGSI
jgi:CRISPR-associated protein Cmr2